MEDRRRGGDYCGSRLVGRWLAAPSSLQFPHSPVRRFLKERWEQIAGDTQYVGSWRREESRLREALKARLAKLIWRSCQLEMEAVSVHKQMKHGRPRDTEKTVSLRCNGKKVVFLILQKIHFSWTTTRAHPVNASSQLLEDKSSRKCNYEKEVLSIWNIW